MKRVIKFMSARYYAYAFSTLIFAVGLTLTFIFGGFNFGIDFANGISMTVQIQQEGAEKLSMADIRNALSSIKPEPEVQMISLDEKNIRQFNVRIKSLKAVNEKDINNQKNLEDKVVSSMNAAFVKTEVVPAADPSLNQTGSDTGEAAASVVVEAGKSNAVTLLQSEFTGPSQSKKLMIQTILIVFIALLLMGIYVWFRFKISFAFGALMSLVHDTVLTVALIGAIQMEISTAVIAAILTLIGYSINDTIVVFDRIRENIKLHKDDDIRSVVDFSITSTLSRTIITSLTTFVSVVPLAIFATGSVKDFSIVMLFGIVIGTYSSIFIASPLVVAWNKAAKKGSLKKEVKKYGAAAVEKKAVAERKLEASLETIPTAIRKLKGKRQTTKK